MIHAKYALLNLTKMEKRIFYASRQVKYGYAATAPLGISRKGYTFLAGKESTAMLHLIVR